MTSISEAYQLARGVGLGHDNACTAVAIAMAESSLNPDAIGDVALEDATWGPSVGLWQIRSVKAETGHGSSRDASRLKDPAFNARSMGSISSKGSNFHPWSTFNSGAYLQNASLVLSTIGGSTGVDAPVPNGGALPGGSGGVQNAGFPDPGDLLGGAGDIIKGGSGAVAGAAGGAVGDLVDALSKSVLTAAAVTLGIALVGIGAWRAVQ